MRASRLLPSLIAVSCALASAIHDVESSLSKAITSTTVNSTATTLTPHNVDTALLNPVMSTLGRSTATPHTIPKVDTGLLNPVMSTLGRSTATPYTIPKVDTGLPVPKRSTLRRSAASSYTIQGMDIGQDTCNTDVTAGSILNVRWALDNATAAVGDGCYLAIRSAGNTVDDDAYVVDKHLPCDFLSTNIVIPNVAHDPSLLLNGSNYFVRLNVPNTGHGMLDSCVFRLQHEGYHAPYTPTSPDIIAIIAIIVAFIGTILAAVVGAVWGRRTSQLANKTSTDTELTAMTQ